MKKNMLFRECSEKWLYSKLGHVKESSWLLYKYNLERYLLPRFGNVNVVDINNVLLEKVINELITNDFSKNTVKNYVSIIKSILYFAMNDGIIPIKRLSLHLSIINRVLPKIIYTPKISIIKKLNEVTSSIMEPCSLGIKICLNTGIRIGELCGLKWEDIDMNEKMINIKRTVQRVRYKDKKTKVIITDPKTRTSLRDIPMSEELYITLKKYRLQNKSLFLVSNSETPLEPRSFRRLYANFLHKYDIPYMKFHMLRHVFATNCVKIGADYKALSELLGHASIRTTMDLYVHPQIEEKRKYIENLVSLYNK